MDYKYYIVYLFFITFHIRVYTDLHKYICVYIYTYICMYINTQVYKITLKIDKFGLSMRWTSLVFSYILVHTFILHTHIIYTYMYECWCIYATAITNTSARQYIYIWHIRQIGCSRNCVVYLIPRKV